MSSGTIKLQVDGPVARVSVSNPARYNAMSLSMWNALADTVDTLSAAQDVRVVLLRGEGAKAFVSGADISEFEAQRSNPEAVKAYDEAVHRAQTALAQCAKPVVALIHGVCMGGGIGLAMSCDLRYASYTARFRMPAARMGLGYDPRGMRRLVELAGTAAVADIFYPARHFDGIEAQRLGFVQQSFSEEMLDAEVEKTVAMIAQNAPLTIAAAKLAIRAAASGDAEETAAAGQAVQGCFDSFDYREGRAAFAEKRAPRFRGE